MSAISFKEVGKRYPGGHEALRGVTLDVEPGDMVFLTGHSGAGKSTLLKLIPAVERPTQGAVLVNGQNVGRMRAPAIPYLRRNLGLVFQDQKLLHDRNAFENVVLPLAAAGVAPRDAAKRVRAALDKVGLLDRERSNPATLSGGEQQRLCIARAIVNRPSILLADEPTANIDADLAAEIMAMFRDFNGVGVTVIIATHDLGLAARFASRTIRLDHGRVAR
ncbi:MAG: cell division ATP-binding protein FtsE [Burkholderiales bacterium]|nr:cell division ATP-binding protein FtsE [Burkholderiales bacterium]